MPLILAIEPDRKQAGRITTLARELPGAELVLADSTERALAALDGRVPNLILTSLLLSPKDEAGLRALSGAGLPVPTLMIPVFATATRESRARSGFLARLPWSRAGATSAAPGTTGCDPAVFASQIWEYLQSATPEDEPNEDASVDEIAVAGGAGQVETVEGDAVAAASVAGLDRVEEADPQALAPRVHDEAVPTVSDEPAAILNETQLAAAAGEDLAWRPFDEPDPVPLSAVTAADAPAATDAEDFVISDVDERVLSVDAPPEPVGGGLAPVSWDELSLDEDESATAIELSGDPIDLRAFVEQLEAAELEFASPDLGVLDARDAGSAEEPATADWAIAGSVIAGPDVAASMGAVTQEFDATPRVTVAHALPRRAAWPPLEGILAVELSPEDLFAIVADFETALEDELESPANADADSELWMPLSVGAMSWPRLENACSRPRPLQDEWGFFDPEQCGFSALVAKLEQVAK